jgi:3-oxoacyl-[acyl-carrier-protein] synthase II
MSATPRRAVVTGMGVVTSLGHDLDTVWDGIASGRSGIAPIERFDASEYPVRFGAEVRDFGPAPMLGEEERRGLDLAVQFAVEVGLRALCDARLEIGRDVDAGRVAVMMASGAGAQMTIEEVALRFLADGPGAVGPGFLTTILTSMVAARLVDLVGARGPASTVALACSSGANAIGDALRLVQRGDADAVVCGGADSVMYPLGVAGFCAAKALSTRNDDPTRASRPFDRDRDGFVLGEGAAAFVLEELEHARARGVPVYAELIGYGSNCDAYHMTMPRRDGGGAAGCMRLAIEDAGLVPEDVGYVNMHGTATKLGDVAETRALKAVYGEHAYTLPSSSTKSMTGHLLGAAGALEAVLAVLALHRRTLPPTINLDNPDAQCDLDYVANVSRPAEARVAMTNSFAFGGHNTTLVFGRR